MMHYLAWHGGGGGNKKGLFSCTFKNYSREPQSKSNLFNDDCEKNYFVVHIACVKKRNKKM